jgi:hypothetical protein
MDFAKSGLWGSICAHVQSFHSYLPQGPAGKGLGFVVSPVRAGAKAGITVVMKGETPCKAALQAAARC